MKYFLSREGKCYIASSQLQVGDTELPPRPSLDHVFLNGSWVDKKQAMIPTAILVDLIETQKCVPCVVITEHDMDRQTPHNTIHTTAPEVYQLRVNVPQPPRENVRVVHHEPPREDPRHCGCAECVPENNRHEDYDMPYAHDHRRGGHMPRGWFDPHAGHYDRPYYADPTAPPPPPPAAPKHDYTKDEDGAVLLGSNTKLKFGVKEVLSVAFALVTATISWTELNSRIVKNEETTKTLVQEVATTKANVASLKEWTQGEIQKLKDDLRDTQSFTLNRKQ